MLGRLFARRHRLAAGAPHPVLGYYPEWERKDLPSYGNAQQYAYETLGLIQFSPIDHAIHTPRHLLPYQAPQVEAVQTLPSMGIATQAGVFRLTPLFDPAKNIAKPTK